jgi:hypothetical protein
MKILSFLAGSKSAGKLTVLLICFLLLATAAIGQHRQLTDADITASGAKQLLFADLNGLEADRLAEKDIAAQTPFLILQSGVAPVAYATDSVFEQKFGVYYREEGCSGSETARAKQYNARVLQHLTEQYGRAWIKFIRKDVVGLKEWKKVN